MILKLNKRIFATFSKVWFLKKTNAIHNYNSIQYAVKSVSTVESQYKLTQWDKKFCNN